METESTIKKTHEFFTISKKYFNRISEREDVVHLVVEINYQGNVFSVTPFYGAVKEFNFQNLLYPEYTIAFAELLKEAAIEATKKLKEI